MKQLFLLVPEGLTFEELAEEQKTAVNMVFGQYVNPVPGTKPFEGYQLVLAVTVDGFDPALMQEYGIDWPILGMWAWDGESDAVETLIELDQEAFLKYLPDMQEIDFETGEVLSTTPPSFHIPCAISGWPELV